MSFMNFTTRLSLFITVLVYVLNQDNITAEKVFILTAYYNVLRQTMTVFFPQGKYEDYEYDVTVFVSRLTTLPLKIIALCSYFVSF